MMTGRQHSLLRHLLPVKTQKLHFFRQIYRPAHGILFIDRGYHDTLPYQKLVLHPARDPILRPDKAERPCVHFIFQRRFHKFAVEIGKKPVTQPDNPAEGFYILKSIGLLPAGPSGGMIPHQRHKDTERHPPHHQILRGICTEAPDIGP